MDGDNNRGRGVTVVFRVECVSSSEDRERLRVTTFVFAGFSPKRYIQITVYCAYKRVLSPLLTECYRFLLLNMSSI